MASEDEVGRGAPTGRRSFLRGAAATAGFGVLPGSTIVTGEETDDRATLPSAPRLGANLNGRPRRLLDRLDLLDHSDTTWVRAFLDVRRKLRDGGRPRNDPDVVALRRAARERDCRLVVNLKWDFAVNWRWDDKEPARVPEPGSDREAALFRCAARYLRAIGEPLDVVVLGNEPMWETRGPDVRGDDPAVVGFTRRAKDHLVARGDHGAPRYLVGAFNRLHDSGLRTGPFAAFCDGLFGLAREDDEVDGVDLHVHYDGLAQAEEALRVARERVPRGHLAVTEFSPVHRYDRHVRTPVGEWEAGRAFAATHGYPAEMRAVDYFERAKADPVPADELGAFFEAMPWYRGDHLRVAYRLFERYGVGVAALGFLQGRGMRNADWRRPGWTPFHVNFLYQRALLSGRGAHPLYLDDYRRLAGPSTQLPESGDGARSILHGQGPEWPTDTGDRMRRSEE